MKTKLPTLQLNAQHILYGISIANALRLAWAYATADAGGNVFSVPGVFGSLLGASISVGTAFVAGKLGGKMTNTRKSITWTVLVLLLVLEPVILAPITMTHMSVAMVTLLGPVAGWIWSVILALVPSLLIVGIAVANGGLVEATAPKPQSETSDGNESQATAESGSAKKSGRSKAQSEKSEAQVTVACRYSPQCERTFTKATLLQANNAANAHASKCVFKPLQTALPPIEQKVEKPA